jgi:hypothetical protein
MSLFAGVYAETRYNFSATNNLILNLKKSPERRGKPDWRYKAAAIAEAADLLRGSLDEGWLATGPTFVPIPCSKSRGHPLHDDRMMQVLRRLTHGCAAQALELIVQTEDFESFHAGCRLRPDQLAQYYVLDAHLSRRKPREVVLFDDMLTTGCHFKAAQAVVSDCWPDLEVAGIFLARVVRPEVREEDVQNFLGG